MIVVVATNVVNILPAAAVLHYPNYGVTPVSALAFVGTGLVGPLFGRLLYFNAIEKIGASRAEPFKGTTPLHATVLAVLFLSEAVSLVHFLAIVVLVVGIAAIS
jgi:drug/metabolite transporter (DMT)-like permease